MLRFLDLDQWDSTVILSSGISSSSFTCTLFIFSFGNCWFNLRFNLCDYFVNKAVVVPYKTGNELLRICMDEFSFFQWIILKQRCSASTWHNVFLVESHHQPQGGQPWCSRDFCQVWSVVTADTCAWGTQTILAVPCPPVWHHRRHFLCLRSVGRTVLLHTHMCTHARTHTHTHTHTHICAPICPQMHTHTHNLCMLMSAKY